MKNLYILFFIVLTINISSAQNLQNANWYFGDKAGLSFNNSTVSELTDIPTNSDFFTSILEGSATISNKNGELLFYTNGTKVYSANHQVMENGTGLLGHPSSSQNVVIIPDPANYNRFYIATIDGESGNGYGLHYSHVDLSYNNGLGKVINKNTILKDHMGISIGPSYNHGSYKKSEKITTTFNSDGVNYWLVTQIKNYVYSYSVTANGISSTPIDHYTLSQQDQNDFPSCIKISPDGTKIATSLNNDSLNIGIKYGNFNPATGEISDLNNIIYKEFNELSSSNFEFSPNSQNLYFVMINTKRKLYKYNFQTSQKVLMLQTFNLIRSLQLGINGKIYQSTAGTNKMSVIEDPNNFNNPNFSFESITLSRNTSSGLPQWVYWHDGENNSGQCESVYLTSEPNNSYDYEFNWSITTSDSYTVTNQQTISMEAQTFIQLNPNTFIQEGADYLAYTGICLDYRPQKNMKSDFKSSEIKNNLTNQYLTLFPNPTSNFVEINYQKGISNIIITSIDGKTIYQGAVNNTTHTLDTKTFTEGIYLVSIQTNEGDIITKKLIVK